MTVTVNPRSWRPAFLDDDGAQAWAASVSGDPEIQVGSRWSNFELVLRSGEETRIFRLAAGRLEQRAAGTVREDGAPPRIELVGTSEAWERYLRPTPPRFHTDVMGMQRRTGEFSVRAGEDELRRNLQVVHRLFELARRPGATRD